MELLLIALTDSPLRRGWLVLVEEVNVWLIVYNFEISNVAIALDEKKNSYKIRISLQLIKYGCISIQRIPEPDIKY